MLKPFYQGKLDTFCAIYAVLNALRITHSIRVLKARDILNETLMALAMSPEAFRAVLEQETDYCNLVDGMLRAQGLVPMSVELVQTGQSRDSGVFGCRCAPDASFLQRLRFHADTRCGYSDHAV